MAETGEPARDINTEVDPDAADTTTEADKEIDKENTQEIETKSDKENSDKKIDNTINDEEGHKELDNGDETNKETDIEHRMGDNPHVEHGRGDNQHFVEGDHRNIDSLSKDVISNFRPKGKQMDYRHTDPLQVNTEREEISALSLPVMVRF